MSNMNDVQALLAWGKVGVHLFGMRILSIMMGLGVIGMCFYVAWGPSWEGVACVALAVACFHRAIAEETKRAAMNVGGQ